MGCGAASRYHAEPEQDPTKAKQAMASAPTTTSDGDDSNGLASLTGSLVVNTSTAPLDLRHVPDAWTVDKNNGNGLYSSGPGSCSTTAAKEDVVTPLVFVCDSTESSPRICGDVIDTMDVSRKDNLAVRQCSGESPTNSERHHNSVSRRGSKPVKAVSYLQSIRERLAMSVKKQDFTGFLKGKPARSLVRNQNTLYALWSGGRFEDDFQIGIVIGSGGFGQVMVATNKTDGTTSAVKTMVKSTDKDIRAMQLNEVQTLVSLDHPHIVKLFRYFESETDIKLVFELCKGRDLLERITAGPMKQRDAAVALRHMLKALKYCHNKYFGHYDVKPENFMYSGRTETNLKMIDFGFSGAFEQEDGQVRGTISYMAPEVVHGILGPEADVWCCGACLFAMLTTWEFTDLDPMGDNQTLMEILKVRFKDRRWSQQRLHEAIEELKLSGDARDLLTDMLIYDRHMRPSVTQALEHPFITTTYDQTTNLDEVEAQAKEVLNRLVNSLRSFTKQPMLKRSALLAMSHTVNCGDGRVKAERAAYRKLDTFGGGDLSVDSLVVGMRRNQMEVPNDLDDLFTYIDVDNDGYICFVDLLAALLPLSLQRDKTQCENLFAVLDINKDGILDTNDLVLAFSYNVGDEGAQKLCSTAITEAGLRPQGVSRAEFMELMHDDQPDTQSSRE